MSFARYLFRMDDITPTMHWDKFWSLITLFQRHKIKPLLGIVPDNRDPRLNCQAQPANFWRIMRSLQDNGIVEFAQHGYQHLLVSRPGAALLGRRYGLREWTEFAGDTYEEQLRKIRAGQRILREHGIETRSWIAPRHSFDRNTLRALKQSGFTAVSDGITLFPFTDEGLTFIPQQFWRPRWMPCGVITICLHSNTITEQELKDLRALVRKRRYFTSFSAEVERYSRSAVDSLLNGSFELVYVTARRTRRIVRPGRSAAFDSESEATPLAG